MPNQMRSKFQRRCRYSMSSVRNEFRWIHIQTTLKWDAASIFMRQINEDKTGFHSAFCFWTFKPIYQSSESSKWVFWIIDTIKRNSSRLQNICMRHELMGKIIDEWNRKINFVSVIPRPPPWWLTWIDDVNAENPQMIAFHCVASSYWERSAWKVMINFLHTMDSEQTVQIVCVSARALSPSLIK